MAADSASLTSYLAVFAMIVIGIIIPSALLVLNKFLGSKPKEFVPRHRAVYESGVEPVGDARQQFSVRYYLVAIIFLLFDVEVVFMYPWALTYKSYLSQGPFVLAEIVLFVTLLLGGYFYLRLRGALDWD